MEPRTAGDEVMASLPSTSGAHWANRDNAPRSRHTGDREAPFRRPPALSSYEDAPGTDQDELSPSAYLPDMPPTSWFADAERRSQDDLPVTGQRGSGGPATGLPARAPSGQPAPGADEPSRSRAGDTYAPGHDSRRMYVAEPASEQQHRVAPEFGPAPPATPGRVSFGVSAGPISPIHRPTSPAAPAHDPAGPAHDPAGPAHNLAAPTHNPAGPTDHRAAPTHSQAAPTHSQAAPAQGQGTPAAPLTATHRPTSPAPAAQALADHGAGGRAYTSDTDTIYKPAKNAHRAGPGGEPPRRRSRLTVVATAVLTALVLAGGGLAGMAYFSGDDTTMKQVLTLGVARGDRTVSAPLDGRTTAQFELVAATTKATVKTADLGDDLYRITAPDGSGVRPSPVLSDDRVQLHLTPDGRQASGNVDVLLSSKVSWALRFTGGADEQVVDLSSGQVSALDVLGGIRRFQLRLPRPIGTVPVHVTGAIEDFSIQSPAGNPVRVRVDSGAKTVAAGKVTLKDVKPGSTLTPKDWKVTNRYDVDAAARVTLLSVGNAG